MLKYFDCGRPCADLRFSDINMLVMDYLVTNGYPSAASKFAMEANIQPKADISSMQERVDVLQAIYTGDIQTAIERINDLNPQVWLSSSFSHLCLLQMIISVSCTTHIPFHGVDEKQTSSVLSMICNL